MNTINDQTYLLDEEFDVEVGKEENSKEAKRLQELRDVSNVIQALENLITQCAGLESFYHIQEFSKKALDFSHQYLRRQIHSR